MSIDARIAAVRHKPDRHILTLARRDGQTPAGRRTLHITRNPDYRPQPGDEIWGNSQECRIGDHAFRRLSVRD